jgi:hypothetical protein
MLASAGDHWPIGAGQKALLTSEIPGRRLLAQPPTDGGLLAF